LENQKIDAFNRMRSLALDGPNSESSRISALR